MESSPGRGGNQDISRLDVAMNNEVLMRIVHGCADLQKQLQALANREVVLVAVLGNRLTFNQLHHKVRHSCFAGAAIEKLR